MRGRKMRQIFQSKPRISENGQAGITADKTIDCTTLGYIVSCAFRLYQVNHLLGLPPLSARHVIGKGKSGLAGSPDDSDKDDDGGTGAGIGPSQAFLNCCRGQLRQVM